MKSMKEIRRNRTYYANKKAEEKKRRVADDSDETIQKKLDSVKKKLTTEMSKQQPNIRFMKDLLDDNRQLRMGHAKTNHYRIHIEFFPCLVLPDLVSII